MYLFPCFISLQRFHVRMATCMLSVTSWFALCLIVNHVKHAFAPFDGKWMCIIGSLYIGGKPYPCGAGITNPTIGNLQWMPSIGRDLCSLGFLSANCWGVAVCNVQWCGWVDTVVVVWWLDFSKSAARSCSSMTVTVHSMSYSRCVCSTSMSMSRVSVEAMAGNSLSSCYRFLLPFNMLWSTLKVIDLFHVHTLNQRRPGITVVYLQYAALS